MDPSIDENAPGLESSKIGFNFAQSKSGIINRVIGFFIMSDEERTQAGIELGERPVELEEYNSNNQEISDEEVKHSGRTG